MKLRIPMPGERQRLFMADTHRYVAFGGARGGGKSWAVRVHAGMLALKYPGIKILIVRRTYPELRQNHIIQMCETFRDVAIYRDVNKELTFVNGSRVIFRYCETEKDLERFQGLECDVLFLDEATQLPEIFFIKLKAIIRGINEFPKQFYLTCNPGGVGHAWVKRLFVDRIYNDGETPEDYSFIRSLVTDNKALMRTNPDYIRQLEALPDKLRKAWLEGDWNIFDGQFFEEFAISPSINALAQTGLTADELIRQRRFVHVIEPFEIPREWKIYRSFDWGFNKPFSCDWWAVDYDGRAYLILQYYGCTKTPNEGVHLSHEDVFGNISRIEKEHKWLKGKQIRGVADPAIWQENGGEPIIEKARKLGIYFDKADNSRIPGWMQCHTRLKFDSYGYPMVYFFKGCEAAIRTLPLLQYDLHTVEDVDTEQEDHFADSFRYFCMSRPLKPILSADDKPKYVSDPLNLMKDRR